MRILNSVALCAGRAYNVGMKHIPVLIDEVLTVVGAHTCAPGREYAPLQNKTIIDCTFGAGGYSRAFLERGANVIAFDRDPSVAPIADALGREFPGKFQFINAPFSEIACLTPLKDGGTFDAIVFDLGVSSMQIDMPERGFSFRFDAPLDMRMGSIAPSLGGGCHREAMTGGGFASDTNEVSPRPTTPGTPPQEGNTAADLIKHTDVGELARILRDYGDVKKAKIIAGAMKQNPPETTFQLKNLIHDPRDIAPVFQALRIAVNDEMGELERAMAAVPALLSPGGVCAVVTFHSLEDRLVKNTFREWTAPRGDRRIPDFLLRPLISGGQVAGKTDIAPAPFRMLKAAKPSPSEIAANFRARSAHLRAGIKV